ncbi:hypothetical protein LguiA_003120 [Lonicera macranthoides]
MATPKRPPTSGNPLGAHIRTRVSKVHDLAEVFSVTIEDRVSEVANLQYGGQGL